MHTHSEFPSFSMVILLQFFVITTATMVLMMMICESCILYQLANVPCVFRSIFLCMCIIFTGKNGPLCAYCSMN